MTAAEPLGGRAPVAVLDSITKLRPANRGAAVVAGSHGGVYCGWLAAECGVRAVVLNDAGVGLDDAGIACLAPLDRIGMAAATVDCFSARIGDGQDMMRRGRISHVNATAAALGCTAGDDLASCLAFLRKARMPSGSLPAIAESRLVLTEGIGANVRVVGLDSVSLIAAQDRRCIVVTGSHGGLLGGVRASAVRQPCLAAVFNDAGGGADGAGYSRLPALDAMGIAGLTVAHTSARIGDARSTWATGVVSAVNDRAQRTGVCPGMTLQSAVDCIAARLHSR
jgi:hypothetical protein